MLQLVPPVVPKSHLPVPLISDTAPHRYRWAGIYGSYLLGCGYHCKVHPQGFEVALSAADLVSLGVPKLQEVFRSLGLPQQIQRVAVILDDCPVWVVRPNRSVDLKPGWKFH